jgi:hypothetical protein
MPDRIFDPYGGMGSSGGSGGSGGRRGSNLGKFFMNIADFSMLID